MATVFIPTSMQKLTGGENKVVVPGSTVREIVRNLDTEFPGIKERLVDGFKIKSNISVAVDGEISPLGILEKVGEECTETLLAAKDAEHSGDTRDLVYETADLWFHSLVMLSRLGLGPKDILDELASRFDLSGLEEKASRNP